MTLQEAEEYLREHFPLARFMDIRLEEYTGGQLVIKAPLALNHNHHGTAFGGALNALATFAAYGIVWMETKDSPKSLVIKESRIAFRRPITGDLRAIGHRPPPEEMAKFYADLEQKGKGYLNITATMDNDAGETAVSFEGTFVVWNSQD